MIILFLHRSFPAQFKHLAAELAKDKDNKVYFITADAKGSIQDVEKIVYSANNLSLTVFNPMLQGFGENILHGKAAAIEMEKLKNKGVIPDVIVGHPWGPTMFAKDVFSEVPFVSYFEWFNQVKDSVFDFGGSELSEERKETLLCSNSHVLLDLESCDGGYSPTEWQKQQFPKEFSDKIKVMHDGIDLDICKPNQDAEFKIPGKDILLTQNDEVITYATRGMEPYRGFPQFMEAVEFVLKQRPNAQVVIAGSDAVCYGQKLESGTYKELMLNKLDLDLDRVHFVGALRFDEYIKLLQISSVHVYLTYPMILSWSFLEAMAAGCCIISSKTKPVLEFMKDEENGFLVNFFDVQGLVDKINYVLDNQDKVERIRENARQTVFEKCDLKAMLPKQVDYIKSFIKK